MEPQGNYDSRAVNWAHPMNNSTHLPPKSPHGGNASYSMFSSTSLFETGTLIPQQPTHRRSPSAGYVQGSWLSSAGSPDIVLKRCSHRRSSSDSVAFVDNSYQYMNYLEHVTEEEDEYQEPDHAAYRPAHRRGVSADHCSSGDHRLPATHRSYPEKCARGDPNISREQFAFQRQQQQQQQQNNLAAYNRAKSESDRGKVKKHVTLATPPPNKSDNHPVPPPRGRSLSWSVPISFENRSTASESNSHSDDSNDDVRAKSYELRFRGDSEEGQGDCTSSTDQVDPKKAKRILANRQSAQRSRVRKLQYISELEMNVNLLETEVASLSPKVGFVDHERALLSAENALLKQKLAALTKTQRLKEAYNETLKTEVQRLRQLQQTQQYSSQQQQQQYSPLQQQQQQRPLSPDSVELQLLRFSKLELGPPNLPKSPQGRISLGKPSLYPITQPISISNNSRIISNLRTSPGSRAGAMSPPSCMAPMANTGANSFMVHNSS